MAQELAGKQVAHWAGWRERDGSSGAEPKEEETATSGNDEGDKNEGQ